MDESSRTTVPATRCRVAWCVNAPCDGDHLAGVGGPDWPGVIATAWSADRSPQVAVGPTWGEVDDCDPAVMLVIDSHSNHNDLEWSCDLRPTEALSLAQELLRAVEGLDPVRTTS